MNVDCPIPIKREVRSRDTVVVLDVVDYSFVSTLLVARERRSGRTGCGSRRVMTHEGDRILAFPIDATLLVIPIIKVDDLAR